MLIFLYNFTEKNSSVFRYFFQIFFSDIFLISPNFEFFVKRIKAQADLQFVKIFGD